MSTLHKTLDGARWATFSLAVKMMNIDSELARAESLEQKGFPENARNSLFRALELLDLTTTVEQHVCRRRELLRLRELLADSISGGNSYGETLQDIRKYLDPFSAIVAKERGA